MSESKEPTLLPVHLEKTDDRRLLIRWQHGVEQAIPFRRLRRLCRCAHCLEKKDEDKNQSSDGKPKLSNSLPVLSAAEARPLDILSMEPAGNYAYRIQFSDGHSSGIFSFELIYWIGQQADE